MTSNDWRLNNSPGWDKGSAFRYKQYYIWQEGWDHDHCSVCYKEFLPPGTETQSTWVAFEGYALAAHDQFDDDYDWVCAECFELLRIQEEWRVTQ